MSRPRCALGTDHAVHPCRFDDPVVRLKGHNHCRAGDKRHHAAGLRCESCARSPQQGAQRRFWPGCRLWEEGKKGAGGSRLRSGDRWPTAPPPSGCPNTPPSVTTSGYPSRQSLHVSRSRPLRAASCGVAVWSAPQLRRTRLFCATSRQHMVRPHRSLCPLQLLSGMTYLPSPFQR